MRRKSALTRIVALVAILAMVGALAVGAVVGVAGVGSAPQGEAGTTVTDPAAVPGDTPVVAVSRTGSGTEDGSNGDLRLEFDAPVPIEEAQRQVREFERRSGAQAEGSDWVYHVAQG